MYSRIFSRYCRMFSLFKELFVCENDSDQSGPMIINDGSNFVVTMNMSYFAVKEIKVEIVDQYLVVHGEHELRKDKYGYVKRSFTRYYDVPQDYQIDKYECSLSPRHVLTIKIPKKPKKPKEIEEPKKPKEIEEPKKPKEIEEPKKPKEIEEPKASIPSTNKQVTGESSEKQTCSIL